MEEEEPPILTAVSSSARQLYLLLRCIAFSNKAHVQISDIGLKLAVDEASVMEGTLMRIYYPRIPRLTRLQHPPSSTNLSSRPTLSMRPPHPTTPNTPTATMNSTRHPLPLQHSKYPFPLSLRPSKSSVSRTLPHPNHHGRATLLTPRAQPSPETTY
jgi:hypothetical protein